MYVIFSEGQRTSLAMPCFHDDQTRQAEMMHRQNIDKQVKDWQETNSGNPPTFYSKIVIEEFTNRPLRFSNILMV